MTKLEIQTERRVIYETRLGILCGSAPPTSEQIEIATAEADAWETAWRALCESDSMPSGKLLL